MSLLYPQLCLHITYFGSGAQRSVFNNSMHSILGVMSFCLSVQVFFRTSSRISNLVDLMIATILTRFCYLRCDRCLVVGMRYSKMEGSSDRDLPRNAEPMLLSCLVNYITSQCNSVFSSLFLRRAF